MHRILVIDDEKTVRDIIKKFLEKQNYIVDVAENGVTGLGLYNKNPADVVITDLFMPEKDGLETIKELLICNCEAKCIMISGNFFCDGVNYRRIAEKLGAVYTLPKPLNFQELLTSVEHVLNNN